MPSYNTYLYTYLLCLCSIAWPWYKSWCNYFANLVCFCLAVCQTLLLGLCQLIACFQVAPQLVKPATSKPVHDSQDSFFELTQRPEPRVKMSMYACMPCTPGWTLPVAFDQQACCGGVPLLDVVGVWEACYCHQSLCMSLSATAQGGSMFHEPMIAHPEPEA